MNIKITNIFILLLKLKKCLYLNKSNTIHINYPINLIILR
jgi:hypothetical protein